jgi:hypothetical protein
MELIAPEFLARATITARTPFDLDSLQGVWNAGLCSALNFKINSLIIIIMLMYDYFEDSSQQT